MSDTKEARERAAFEKWWAEDKSREDMWRSGDGWSAPYELAKAAYYAGLASAADRERGLREALERYRTAMDAIYNHSAEGRRLVVQNF